MRSVQKCRLKSLQGGFLLDKMDGATSKNRGFTLIEILIAIFIFGIVMATILGTFTGIISSSRQAETKVELHQTGRAIIDLISTDLRSIFRLPVKKGPFFVAVEESVEGKPMSRVDFITTNSLAKGVKGGSLLSEVGYRVTSDSKEHSYTLWRRSHSPPELPYNEGGREVPICRIVDSFKLEFVSNNDKKMELSHSIPKGIIIDLSLRMDGENEKFVTMVRPMITLGE